MYPRELRSHGAKRIYPIRSPDTPPSAHDQVYAPALQLVSIARLDCGLWSQIATCIGKRNAECEMLLLRVHPQHGDTCRMQHTYRHAAGFLPVLRTI